MTLQVNEFEMSILKTSLEDRLGMVNHRVALIKGGIGEAEDIMQQIKSKIFEKPGALEYWEERAQELGYKRDILMEEVYQLEKLLHEVNITQK